MQMMDAIKKNTLHRRSLLIKVWSILFYYTATAVHEQVTQ